ncbi:MAG: hypothetical protein ACKO0V_03930 [bacterium]
MWKQSLKNLLYRVAPRWTTEFMSARARAYSQKMIASWGCGEVNRLLADRCGMKVLSGPWAGMTLGPAALSEQLGPYLLGVYESELDAAWAQLLQQQYTQIVDIGAKFGYYAVGLARLYPAAPVIAFDTDWWARQAIHELAAANQTTNVNVCGYCSPEWLVSGVKAGALVVSDCEGFESALFSQATIQSLTKVTLIIETHDCFVPGVSDRLEQLFRGSHDCRRVGLTEQRRPSPVNLDFLTAEQRKLAEHEVRDRQVWLVCTPR